MAGIHDSLTAGSAAKGAGSSQRELTPRALATGLILGALLAPCNVYSGLKIGWSFNMSITALLLAFAFWAPIARLFHRPSWGMLESNINQTAASAAAAITSSGLVAPIPALAAMTGENLHVIQEILPVSDLVLRFRIPVGKEIAHVTLRPAGVALDVTRSGDWASVTVPNVWVHEAVVVNWT